MTHDADDDNDDYDDDDVDDDIDCDVDDDDVEDDGTTRDKPGQTGTVRGLACNEQCDVMIRFMFSQSITVTLPVALTEKVIVILIQRLIRIQI